MSKLASAAAGFVSGVMCYYFVRDRVWGRAEGVAAQLQEMQADVPALARRPVKVTRPGLVENEDRIMRDVRAETLARWNDTVMATRKFLMDNVVDPAGDGEEGARKQ